MKPMFLQQQARLQHPPSQAQLLAAARPAWGRRSCSTRPRAGPERLEAAAEGSLEPQAIEPVEATGLPRQGDLVVAGTADEERIARQLVEILKPPSDVDYLQEFLALQDNGPRNIGFFGTRNMGFMHQQLIEVLSYAMILTGNHIFTSGATGTNAAVIRGALRAEKPDLLTVVLPQSMHKQPQESQELLKEVQNVIAMPQNDTLSLMEASRICNQDIIGRVKQVICFAFHDSSLLLETCQAARQQSKIVTLFYLD